METRPGVEPDHVILNVGEAGMRDRTTAESFRGVEGNPFTTDIATSDRHVVKPWFDDGTAAAQLQSLPHHADRHLGIAVEAHALLHGRGDERRVAIERVPLIGVVEEREDGVAEEVRGGRVPGEEQEDAGGDDLLGAQTVDVVPRADERGDQISSGIGPIALDQALEVRDELEQRLVTSLVAVGLVEGSEDE